MTRLALEDLAPIRRRLETWYAAEHRDFPWRGSSDPYAILVSEVMLQQTQAARVVRPYERFMGRFPTAAALAAAPQEAVLAEWSGLGYNRRALSLQRAASRVAEGGWPREVPGLQALPGVGPYTARAIASLAFGIRVGVVDTNVRRWLVRRFSPHVTDAPRDLQRLADGLAALGAAPPDAAAWTHASMEFGARVCRARRPLCVECPIAPGCPSRGAAPRVAVPRQAPLMGSDRAYRGAVLRLLAAADGHVAGQAAVRRRLSADRGLGPTLDAERWERITAGLERDGLVHRSGDDVRLGAATIGS